MKVGTKIVVPTDSRYIKEYKDSKGNPYYSFFYNYSTKEKDSDNWEVQERYVINVMNIEVEAGSTIAITTILDCKPKVMKDSKGKEHLNCIVFVYADNIQKGETPQPTQQQNNYENNYNQQINNSGTIYYDDDTDDLPF